MTDIWTGVFLLVVSLFSAFSALVVLGWAVGKRLGFGAPSLGDSPDRIVLTFEKGELVEATAKALLMVGAPLANKAVWERLGEILRGQEEKLRKLDEDGRSFVSECESPLGPCALVAKKNGGLTILELQLLPKSTEPFPIVDRLHSGDASMIADLSPMLIWHTDTSGKIIWFNKGYGEFCVTLGEARGEEDATAAFTMPDVSGKPLRQKIVADAHGPEFWFDVVAEKTSDGGHLCFALRADPVVAAEKALRNFVQTLTKTFAHLPIGLAVFDRSRQLALFNPSLTGLTTLEPEWLGTRPTLSAFLDRLREYRHVPEPRDYKTWRARISELEKAAEEGTYEETWPLPNGRTYKVTGRPHPEGAVALLFEDITPALALQRQFRSQLELSQNVLDALPEAIAVFARGEMVFSNTAFSDLWGIDPNEMPSGLSLGEAIGVWQSRSHPDPVWEILHGFADSSARLCNLTRLLVHADGSRYVLRATPLSGGNLLCAFAREGEGSLQPIQPRNLAEKIEASVFFRHAKAVSERSG